MFIFNLILLIIAVVALVYFRTRDTKDKVVRLSIFFWSVMLIQDVLQIAFRNHFATVLEMILLLIAIATLVIELVHIFKKK